MITKRKHQSLVYSTTRWQEQLFDKRAAGSGLSSAVAATAKALTLVEEEAPKAAALGLEVFSRLYDAPEKLEEPDAGSPWAVQVHAMFDDMDEFSSLAALTSSDPDMAALATAEMLKAVEGRLGELVREAKAPAPEAQEPGVQLPGFSLTAGDKVRAVLRGAARDARVLVQEAKGLLDGIAPGMGSAPALHEQQDPRRATLAQALLGSANLRQIIDLAGRLQRIAAKVKKQRNPDLVEEVVDIERGGDLGRVLPSELAGLRSGRTTRLLTMQKIAERTAIQYRLDGREPLGRGEMIVALDESGSMAVKQKGVIPNVWARAIGLACLRIARQDRRAITVVGFNGGLTSRHRMGRDGACFVWTAGAWAPIQGGFAALALEVISRGCSGGTSFDAPISYAVSALAEAPDARPDLLFVTDGEANVSASILEALGKAKSERGLRVFGVAMGGGSITAAMRSVCDQAIDFAPDIAKLAQVVPG
jgi:hypothetical protein